ncbi:MAG: SRPBCC domain-containing protein [Flavobacteriales bacterium]
MTTAVANNKLKLTITRNIAAPRELVFACWTESKHLARWGGAPKGMAAKAEVKEIRTGGRYLVHLLHENGDTFSVQGRYLEVVKPERLVFTHTWLDENGAPGQEMLVTITFEEVGNGTRMNLTQTGFTSAGSRDGHREGWSSQIERFAEYLSSITLS